ncbi:hypothetical protein DMI82_03070 [Blautia sp. BCRC 81119]|nr:hypothetical protein DMI82_03070 [Blautia sp. BCRC 81119]
MLFRHRKRKEMEMQQDSHEDLSCMSCYGNHSSCGCDRCGARGCPGPVGPTAPSIYAQHGNCRNHAAFHYLKDN